MEIKEKYLLIILALSVVIKTESSMELTSYTACYGILGNQNFLLPSCPAGQKIAVMAVYTLAKYKSTGCPQIQTSPGDDPACCQYDVTDCSYLYDSGSFRAYYQTCNGKSSCQIQVSWIDIPSHCNSSVYIKRMHYMKMDYYCIPDQAVDPCTDLTTSDSPVFFWNTGYPAEMTTTSSSCTCSIEMSCDTTVELTAIDLQLKGPKNCKQSLVVTDGSFSSTYDCSSNNDFLPRVMYTSTNHFVTIVFTNNLGITGGKFFIQIQGTNPTGEVTLSCGASALTVSSQNPSSLPTCPIEGDTTTNLPTTGQSTQTDNSTTLTAVSTKDSTILTSMSTENSTTHTAISTEDSTTLTSKSTENSTTHTAMSTEDSTSFTTMSTEDSTTLTSMSTENSTTPTSTSTENSTTHTAISTKDSTTLTSKSTENSTTHTAMSTKDFTTLTRTSTSTENSSTLFAMSTKDSTTLTSMSTEDSTTLTRTFTSTEDSTTLTSMSTEDSTTPTIMSTKDSTTLTAMLIDSSTVSTRISHNVTTKYSTKANVMTTVSSTATTTVLTTEDSKIFTAVTTDSPTALPSTLLNVKTEISTTLTPQTTEDFKTSTALTTEDSTTPTAQTTEDFTTKAARTTENSAASTARTTRDFTKLSDMSTDSKTLSLSTQDATTSGFSLNMTTMINVSIENNRSSSPDTENGVNLPVVITIVVLLVIGIGLLVILCYCYRRRRCCFRNRGTTLSIPLQLDGLYNHTVN